MEQLDGKVAVVTGAASGIGRSLAHRLAAEGMRVVMADIEEPALADAASSMPAGSTFVTTPCDVASGAQIEALRDTAIEAFGAVHLVCNNAGVGGGGPMSAIDIDAWKWVIDVDLWSVIHGVRVFLPLLVEQGEGHIVNTASVAGLFAAPYMGPYNVAKYGVVALSETLFSELAAERSPVGVSVLCPSWVRTNIATSVRNRPGVSSDEVDALGEIVQGFISQGIDPDEVAGRVVDAVRARQFWIITHDDTDAAVSRRASSITERTDPPLLMH